MRVVVDSHWGKGPIPDTLIFPHMECAEGLPADESQGGKREARRHELYQEPPSIMSWSMREEPSFD